MAEHEGLVSVAVAAAAAATGESKTLMEGSENRTDEPFCEEDGGDVMVEIVGSDVFVDGIPGQVGGEDGAAAEGDLRSVDREEEGEDKQEVAGSSDEPEQDAEGVGEEGLEEGEQLASREVEVSSVVVTEETTVLNEEAQDSGIPIGEGVALVELTSEVVTETVTETVVTETIVETVVTEVNGANVKEGLVEDGAEGGVAAELLLRSEGVSGANVKEGLVEDGAEGGVTCDPGEASAGVGESMDTEIEENSVSQEKSTLSHNDHNSGAEIGSEPTEAIADTEMEAENDKVSLDAGEVPSIVVASGVVPDKVVAISSELRSSTEQTETDYVVTSRSDVTQLGTETLDQSGKEPLSTLNEVADVQVPEVGGAEQTETDQTEVVSKNEVIDPPVVVERQLADEQTKNLRDSSFPGVDDKISKSNSETQNSDDKDGASVSQEDTAHAPPDLKSSNKQAHFAEIGEVPAGNLVDVMDCEGVVAEVSASLGKDQRFEVDKVVGVLPNDEISGDMEAPGKEIQMQGNVLVDAVVKDGETVPDSKFNVLDRVSSLKKDSESNTKTAGQLTEDDIVNVNAEASEEHNKTGNGVDAILEEPPVEKTADQLAEDDIVNVNAEASEEHNQTGNRVDAILEEPPVEMLHSTAEDHPVGNNTLTANDSDYSQSNLGNHENYPSLPDKEPDMLAQVQAVDSCADVQDECGPVSSSVNKFVESSPGCPDGEVKYEEEAKPCEADETLPEQHILDKCIVGTLVVDLDSLANEDSLFTGDEDPGSGGHVELEFSDCFPRNATDDIRLGEPTVGQEHFTDAEMVDPFQGQGIELDKQVTDQEEAKHLDECSEESLKPGSSAEVHGGSYLLPLENEGQLSVSDLVWGKVKSHPWWPGQIFDPSDASEKAMKYHKKDCFLVAYFGDQTFAWNEASLLKPFWTNYSQIVKQSSSEAFQNSVSCALEEVSRRVQLGLACSCIRKDVYEKIVCQNVQNTGIREDSNTKFGVEKSAGICSFAPHKLVEYMKSLAQSPSAEVDQLELVVAKAQLLAFNRSKDCYRLPSFQYCGGLLEESNSSELGEVIDHTSNNANIVSSRPDTESISSLKRKHNLKDSFYPIKKEKISSELMEDAVSSPDSEDVTDMKASNTLVSSASNKQKGVDFVSNGSELPDRGISIYAAKVSTTASPAPKPTSFKVGECISRIAGQLWSPSILKGNDSEKFRKVEFRSDDSIRDDAPFQTPDNQQKSIISPTEYTSVEEMLSQLHMVAQEPMQMYGSVEAIMPFFSEFRDSISLVHQVGRQSSSTGRPSGSRKRKVAHVVAGTPEEFEFDDVNDSYWTDRIIENGSEEQAIGDAQNSEHYQLMAIDPEKPLKPNRRSNSRKRYSNGNHEMTLVPVTFIDERKRDSSPAELILNFCEGDRIPSEMKLTNIFRRFGPLKESETEVDLENSRARVVFRRGSDADVALSSSEKFSIFGSMIVRYQINYSPSNSSLKDLPPPISEEQEEAL